MSGERASEQVYSIVSIGKNTVSGMVPSAKPCDEYEAWALRVAKTKSSDRNAIVQELKCCVEGFKRGYEDLASKFVEKCVAQQGDPECLAAYRDGQLAAKAVCDKKSQPGGACIAPPIHLGLPHPGCAILGYKNGAAECPDFPVTRSPANQSVTGRSDSPRIDGSLGLAVFPGSGAKAGDAAANCPPASKAAGHP